MKLQETDRFIEPFQEVIAGIEAGLRAIGERVNTEAGFNGSAARDHAEPLLGIGLVAGQTYALGTVCDLNRIRESRGKRPQEALYYYTRDTGVVTGGTTRIELIHAGANYFKLHEQWTDWPVNGQAAVTTRILARAGITPKTNWPCSAAIELLCGTNWRLLLLPEIVKEWRAHLFKTFG
jgi:hypothetical protein